MISFHWAWVLWLIPLPLLIRPWFKPARREAIAVPPALAEALSTGQQRTTAITLQSLSLWLAWILLLLALAQPHRADDIQVQPVSGRAIALAIDVSSSMERRDFVIDGRQTDRLSAVKQVANAFIRARAGDRLSLVLYGKEAFIASPLTFDLNALSGILDGAGIGMAGRSTAIGDAMGLAMQTLRDDPAPQKAIILLSDGTNNAGSVEPESAAELAASLGIRIHTIALGSRSEALSGFQSALSADLDEDTLKAIAQQGQGAFFRATQLSDLEDIYTRIDRLEQAEVQAPPVVLQRDLRFWPLIALLLILCALSLLQERRNND